MYIIHLYLITIIILVPPVCILRVCFIYVMYWAYYWQIFLNPHYIQVHLISSQAIKQMYVLVLGLDVLGNPFGLLRGVAEGIEDLFYEPYQVRLLIEQNKREFWPRVH